MNGKGKQNEARMPRQEITNESERYEWARNQNEGERSRTK